MLGLERLKSSIECAIKQIFDIPGTVDEMFGQAKAEHHTHSGYVHKSLDPLGHKVFLFCFVFNHA